MKNRSLPNRLITTIAFLTVMAAVAAGCGTAGQANTTYPGVAKIDYSWTSLPWTRDGGLFRGVRSQIADEMENGKAPKAIVERWREAAKSHPKNAVALFGWGYSYFYAHLIKGDRHRDLEFYDGCKEALRAMCAIDSPRCYEYDRVRFILAFSCCGGTGEDLRKLVALGDRLLQKEPRDYYIRSYLMDCLVGSFHADLIRRGLGMAQELAGEYPKIAEFRGYVVCANARLYRFGGETNAYDVAIAQYEVLKKHPKATRGILEDAGFQLRLMKEKKLRLSGRK